MSEDKKPPSVATNDYEAIQAAVMETETGRWFLSEFAERNRVADTTILLAAIKKLETVVGEKETTASIEPDVEKMRFDIVDMANAIALTKQEIAGITSGNGDDSKLDCATAELDAIVVAAETATSEILNAAESIQEVAWTMREEGARDVDFDKLDALATDIYMACSFQDITGQRTTKVVGVLQFLENRITAMLDIWGIDSVNLKPAPQEKPPSCDSHLLNGPALDGEGVDQGDIDLMLANEEELFDAVAQPVSEMPPEAPSVNDIEPAEDILPQDLAESVEELINGPELMVPDEIAIQIPVEIPDIDNLNQTDKIALFT